MKLKYSLSYPTKFRFDLDEKKITRRIGKEIAKLIKDSAKQAKGLDGRQFPASPTTPNRTLNATGQTIDSIKQGSKRIRNEITGKKESMIVVEPKGYRSESKQYKAEKWKKLSGTTEVRRRGKISKRGNVPHALVVNAIAKKKNERDMFGTQSAEARRLVSSIGAKLVRKAKENVDFRLKVQKIKKVKK